MIFDALGEALAVGRGMPQKLPEMSWILVKQTCRGGVSHKEPGVNAPSVEDGVLARHEMFWI